MEYYTNEHGGMMLEELVGLTEMGEYRNQELESINDEWRSSNLDCYNNNVNLPTINASLQDCFLDQTFFDYAPFGEQPELSMDSSTINLDTQTLPYLQEDYYAMSFLEDEDGGTLFGNLDIGAPCKLEPESEMPRFEMGFVQRKNKVKKLNGQPSKNLMAERRRRKRLNDRLSMLRSVVPKISKMDRTSILGDTIEYMKELLDRINSLQEEMKLGSNELSLMTIFKDVKPNDVSLRNSPKFEVERREEDTRIEIWCGGKPGLLLSTVTTLEALGLQIHHSVISCFNDFALHASCSQDLKKRDILDSEDIKQALVRNAGYGGRCV